MNTSARGAMNAYSKAGLEASIRDASPHKLIAMLFDGAIVAIGIAKNQMQLNQIAAKGEAVSKAIAIINDGLKLSLDEQAGGELAANLKALYEYMSQRLLLANLNNDQAGLDEVARLLGELKGAWDQIGTRPEAASPAPSVDAAAPRASVSYGKA